MRWLNPSSCLCLSSFLLPTLAQPGTDGKLKQPETMSTVRTDGSLMQPDELISKSRRLADGRNEVEIDLSIEAGLHTTAAASLLQTRLLGGGLPGKTIRVHRGDHLIVNFYNKLVEQPGTNKVLNEFGFVDYANLHFHGCHVSGEAPADDTTIMVPAGGSYRYLLDFPDDHLGGTFWVHTHVHGAGTLHVGGGAALPFIVEDKPGDVPPEVENAEEVILLVQNFDKDEFDEEILPISGDKVFQLEPAEGVDNDFLLVNGQYRPTLDMTAGQWQRWRVIFGAWNKKPLDLAMVTGGACQMNLLAKDGIYIQDYPRAIDLFPIPVGGRADIMVRCETAGLYTVESYLGELFRLNVIEPDNGVVQWNYPTVGYDFFRPSYLSYDVIDSNPSPGCACNTWMDDDKINEMPFNPDVFLHTTARGSTVERTVEGVHSHPYHQHVYPYQLKEFFYDDDADPVEKDNDIKYFKVGDYQDSLTLRSSEKVKIQYVAGTFNGRIAVHCHRITHSDIGMLATEIVLDDGVCECSPREGAVGLTLPPTNRPTEMPVLQLVGSSNSKKSKKKDKKSKSDKKR